jgi:DNA-binding response OmpR family regulator
MKMEKTIRILAVDDEAEILQLIKRYLELEGYQVDTASDGMEGLALFEKGKYDLVLADIMMPGMDGLTMVEKIRAQDSQVLVLFLSAKDGNTDRVLGFKLGADDYVTKPFYMNELTARIAAHLRRYQSVQPEETGHLEFGKLTINIPRVEVKKAGDLIELRAKEFEILAFLASHEGQVFSKGQIFENVWKDDYMMDDNTVMVHIRRLRKKIEDNPDEPRYIKTVWGLGYKFQGGES